MSQHVAAAPLDAPVGGPSQLRASGVALMLTSSASNQSGAALGALAFPVLGPVGVVAIRQLVSAIVLTPIVRPRLRSMTRHQWWPAIGLALSFSVMNLCLYAAVERIGLALAVTLEFLGPLSVALFSSRRAKDLGAAVLATVGVVVLTNPGPSTDLIGIGLGLVAASAWAAYILLNRTLGRCLPGLQGTAVASLITASAWLPVAVIWFTLHTPTATALALAIACGVLSSAVPYAADLLALRRVPTHAFSTFTSINLVWAALAGWIVLHEALGVHQWVGIALIVLSNTLISIGRRPRPATSRVPHLTPRRVRPRPQRPAAAPARSGPRTAPR